MVEKLAPQAELADKIRQLRDQPLLSLITMVDSTRANLGTGIGFSTGELLYERDAVMTESLDSEQFEGIKDVETVLGFLCLGSFTPPEIGRWLQKMTPEQGAYRRVDRLFWFDRKSLEGQRQRAMVLGESLQEFVPQTAETLDTFIELTR